MVGEGVKGRLVIAVAAISSVSGYKSVSAAPAEYIPEYHLGCDYYVLTNKNYISEELYIEVTGTLSTTPERYSGAWTPDTVVTFQPVGAVRVMESHRDDPDQDVSVKREKSLFIKNSVRAEKSWHILAQSGGKVVLDLELLSPEPDADKDYPGKTILSMNGTLNVAVGLEESQLPRKVSCYFRESRYAGPPYTPPSPGAN